MNSKTIIIKAVDADNAPIYNAEFAVAFNAGSSNATLSGLTADR